jgi:hypothetical protein
MKKTKIAGIVIAGLFSFLTLLIVLFLVFEDESPADKKEAALVNYEHPEVSRSYSLPWREPDNSEMIAIGKALAKNKIRGCGDYYIRPSSGEDGEYLVGCSSDSKNWSYYMVWTYASEVVPFTDQSQPILPPR